MAEKPILFSGDMVRAILAGEKTQTRRVITPQAVKFWLREGTSSPVELEALGADGGWRIVKCPYGGIGDTLWVRETWRVGAWNEEDGFRIEYRAGDYCLSDWVWPEDEEPFERLWVQSTEDAIAAGLEADENGNYCWEHGKAPTRWRPSIHMPRWASRIQLKVNRVRVQRIHSMDYDDVEAEGVGYVDGITPDYWVKPWADLWDSINKRRGYSFDSNPWVWVVEFEMLDR